MNYNNSFPNMESILNDKNLTKEEKSKIIQEIYNQYNQKLQNDLNMYLTKKYTGAALEIGSAAIPIGGAGRAGATIGESLLKKLLGKKLSQEIGSGALSGLTSGTVFGAGRSFLEDSPLFKTIMQDALTGLIFGGVIGIGGALGQKYNSAKQLGNVKPIGSLTDTERKKLREMGKQYYKNYLQGRNIKAPFIDSVYFPTSQAGEIGLHNYKMVPQISKQIRNAKNIKITNDKPDRLDAKNFNKLYNSFKNKDYEYVIRNNANNSGNDFYQIKEVGSNPTYSDQPRAFEPEPNNIINDNFKNLNPTNGLIPFTFLNNKILESRIEMNVDEMGNQIFTPEKINNMTSDEFLQNENSIMEQLKQGIFGTQSKDYTGYKNPVTGNNKIFTREDIGNMSGNDYTKFENEINAQLKSVGIPTGSELSNSSGTVFVHGYTRDDGTEVKSHYRSAPSK